uniref:Uncharacterized protein n=1 Tax=Rhizophora mucronata TaxID=61149 RepID=A0A2P2KNA3_RHIMU
MTQVKLRTMKQVITKKIMSVSMKLRIQKLFHIGTFMERCRKNSKN